MALQTKVRRQGDTPVRPGARLGSVRERGSIVGGLALALWLLTIDSLVNNHTYSLSVPGLDGDTEDTTETLSFESDADATNAEVQAGLINAAKASANIWRRWEVYDEGADKVVLEARRLADSGTISTADANLSLSNSVEAGVAGDIPFGRMVMRAERDGEVELISGNTAAAKVVHLTPAAPDAGDQIIIHLTTLDARGGIKKTHAISVTPTGAVGTTVDAMVAAVVAAAPDGVTATDGDTHLVLTGAADGRDFLVRSEAIQSAGSTTVTDSLQTSPVALAPLREIAGISLAASREAREGALEAVHRPGQSLPVAYEGPVSVEVEPGVKPAIGDAVYVRVANDGTKKAGMLTNAADGAATLALPRYEWTDHIQPGKRGDAQVASVFVRAV